MYYYLNMALKTFITVLFYLLPTVVFTTQTENISAQKIVDSVSLYNTALKKFNNNELGFAKGYIEQSLFFNPLNSLSQKLHLKIKKSLAKNLGTQRREEVSFLTYVFDMIPSWFSYILLIGAALLLFYSLARLHFNEASFYKKNPQQSLKVLGFTALFFLSALLHIAKESFYLTKWACTTAPTTFLFTGPSAQNFVQTSSLLEGSCVQVVSILPQWVSLKPLNHPSGWANLKDLMIVRDYKIDPSWNKD